MDLQQKQCETRERDKVRKGHSILVVDDSTDVLNLNKTILEMDGYTVHTAESGGEGMAVLATITPPDLILLDMRMEDMSGAEFLVEMEAKRPDVFRSVPVVFLTAMDEVPDSHAVGVIFKPIEIENFLAAIRHFIEQGPDPRHDH